MLHRFKQSSTSTQWLILGIALTILGLATGFNLYVERQRTEDREQDRLLAQAAGDCGQRGAEPGHGEWSP